MNKELSQAIISKIHGVPWEESRWVDAIGCTKKHIIEVGKVCFSDGYKYYRYVPETDSIENHYGDEVYCSENLKPITLSRVVQAFSNIVDWRVDYLSECRWGSLVLSKEKYIEGHEPVLLNEIYIKWKLLNKDKSTATLEDQNSETIQALERMFLTKNDE